MADWSELPEDLLLKIARKLINVPDDHYRLRCVCRSWSHVILEYLNRCVFPYSPCLMVPGINCDITCKFRRLLSFPLGKDITKEGEHLPQIPVPHVDLCRGSYEGWLVMIKSNMDLYLFNPFSNRRIYLPPLTTLNKSSLGKEPMSKWEVRKAILSKNPSVASDCFVMLLFTEARLAFCKLGDKVWTPIHHQLPECGRYSDALYFKGNFYIVANTAVTYICDLSAIPQPSVTKMEVAEEECFDGRFYLVESKGELLQICCYDQYEPNEDEEEFPEDLHKEDRVNQIKQSSYGDIFFDEYDLVSTSFRSSFKTKFFDAWRLDKVGGSKPSWIEVENLDGVAVFLGLNQSFSLSDPHIFGYKENQIYYTDVSIGAHKCGWLSGDDMGIFDLKEGTIESLYKINSKSVKPPAIWVIPKHGNFSCS